MPFADKVCSIVSTDVLLFVHTTTLLGGWNRKLELGVGLRKVHLVLSHGTWMVLRSTWSESLELSLLLELNAVVKPGGVGRNVVVDDHVLHRWLRLTVPVADRAADVLMSHLLMGGHLHLAGEVLDPVRTSTAAWHE